MCQGETAVPRHARRRRTNDIIAFNYGCLCSMNGEEMKQWSEGGREGGLVERKKEKFKEGSLLHSLLCNGKV